MTIRLLDPTLINQIAAGEVIERPASAIKELVENSIDAGATKIDIRLREGGKTYICITDNGKGMSAEDLTLCVERHATSKIPDNDLFNIQTLGFRGEALPSIGSVSRLKITSRALQSQEAWELQVEGGVKTPLMPSHLSAGTRIEVRDLFFATPARLKFLKAASTELTHTVDIVERLALINPHIDFTLHEGEKRILNLVEGVNRIETILGKNFYENSCEINCQKHDLTLKGWVSIPTYHHSSTANQYLFVNGRPVKDKLLATALRVAYQDVLASNRYPAVCLFLECLPEEVDINVHPAKAEVRFRDPQLVRGFLISALKETLKNVTNQSSTVLADGLLQAFTPAVRPAPLPSRSSSSLSSFPLKGGTTARYPSSLPLSYSQKSYPDASLNEQLLRPLHPQPIADLSTACKSEGSISAEDHYLGYAKTQLHETYIIAETQDDLVIVDQHAAHERLVYEQMKKEFIQGHIKRQSLLIPEVLSLTELNFSIFYPHLPFLNESGFLIEAIAPTGIVIREIPAIMGKCDIAQLVHDIVDELRSQNTLETIKNKIHEILAEKACKNSIRAGRLLSLAEMNALLRQMEKTPSSGQCNHGRPTYVKLGKKELEKLFGRT